MQQRRTLHEVLASLPDDEVHSLLDAGCGTAIAYEHFKNRYSYTGIDVTPLMIERAKEKFPEGNFICKDVLELVGWERRDAVLSSDVLIHVDAPKKHLEVLWELTEKVLILKLAYVWRKSSVPHFDGTFYNWKFNLTELIGMLLALKPAKLEIIRVKDDEKTTPEFSNYQIFVLWK